MSDGWARACLANQNFARFATRRQNEENTWKEEEIDAPRDVRRLFLTSDEVGLERFSGEFRKHKSCGVHLRVVVTHRLEIRALDRGGVTLRFGEVNRRAVFVRLAAEHEADLPARVGRNRRVPVLHRTVDEDLLAHLRQFDDEIEV